MTKKEEEAERDFDSLLNPLDSQTMIVRNLSLPDSFFRQLLYYPLHTLSTNRILNTVISRKVANRNMLQDLRDMFRIGGFRAIYAGIVPF